MLEQSDFRVKAFHSCREFLDSYRPEETGCLVLDVRMPEMDGLALQQVLRERGIRLPIIFITAYGDVPTCAAPSAEERPIFWRNRSTTRCCWSTSKSSSQEQRRRGNGGETCFGDRVGRLTPTESEVLEALIQGKSIKEIAAGEQGFRADGVAAPGEHL